MYNSVSIIIIIIKNIKAIIIKYESKFKPLILNYNFYHIFSVFQTIPTYFNVINEICTNQYLNSCFSLSYQSQLILFKEHILIIMQVFNAYKGCCNYSIVRKINLRLTCHYNVHQNHPGQFEACILNPIHHNRLMELDQCDAKQNIIMKNTQIK